MTYLDAYYVAAVTLQVHYSILVLIYVTLLVSCPDLMYLLVVLVEQDCIHPVGHSPNIQYYYISNCHTYCRPGKVRHYFADDS